MTDEKIKELVDLRVLSIQDVSLSLIHAMDGIALSKDTQKLLSDVFIHQLVARIKEFGEGLK